MCPYLSLTYIFLLAYFSNAKIEIHYSTNSMKGEIEQERRSHEVEKTSME